MQRAHLKCCRHPTGLGDPHEALPVFEPLHPHLPHGGEETTPSGEPADARRSPRPGAHRGGRGDLCLASVIPPGTAWGRAGWRWPPFLPLSGAPAASTFKPRPGSTARPPPSLSRQRPGPVVTARASLAAAFGPPHVARVTTVDQNWGAWTSGAFPSSTPRLRPNLPRPRPLLSCSSSGCSGHLVALRHAACSGPRTAAPPGTTPPPVPPHVCEAHSRAARPVVRCRLPSRACPATFRPLPQVPWLLSPHWPGPCTCWALTGHSPPCSGQPCSRLPVTAGHTGPASPASGWPWRTAASVPSPRGAPSSALSPRSVSFIGTWESPAPRPLWHPASPQWPPGHSGDHVSLGGSSPPSPSVSLKPP